MSKHHRLEGLRRRIAIIKARIISDQAELVRLERRVSVMTAEVVVDSIPEDHRNVLVQLSMSTRKGGSCG